MDTSRSRCPPVRSQRGCTWRGYPKSARTSEGWMRSARPPKSFVRVDISRSYIIHSRAEPLRPVVGLGPKGNVTRKREFDLGSGRRMAANVEPPTKFLCPFAHARQTPMTVKAGLKHLGVYALAVIMNE